jgi:hypothetical protein
VHYLSFLVGVVVDITDYSMKATILTGECDIDVFLQRAQQQLEQRAVVEIEHKEDIYQIRPVLEERRMCQIQIHENLA